MHPASGDEREFEKAIPPDGDTRGDVWRVLEQLSRPHRRQLALIAVLALLSTGADLVQPLIYRTAINDVAGLFVDGAGNESAGMSALEDLNENVPARPPAMPIAPPAPPLPAATAATRVPAPAPAKRRAKKAKKAETKKTEPPAPPAPPPEPHRSDYVAPRTAGQTLSGLWWAVGLLFATTLGAHYLSFVSENRSVALGSRIEANLIRQTFGYVLHLPLTFFSRRATGALSKQIDQSDQVAPIVSALSQEIAPEILRTVGIVAIMLTQSWPLAAVALVGLPVYIWISRQSARRLESGMDRYYEMWEGVSARIQSALAAVKTVKLSGAETREQQHFASASSVAYDDYIARTRLANRYLLLQSALSQLSKASVLGYGGWMVLERRLTPGDVVMFYVYLDRLYDPINSLSSIAVNLQQHLASLGRAVRLLNTGKAEPSGRQLAPGPGAVELRGVSFGYRKSREVLHNLSFRIAPGKTTAIVGPSGAGKTTFADLLLKLYEPNAGEILIDGQSLAEVDPASLRREIGVVAADGAVFRGTLAENIRYKRPEASAEDVREAARAAGLEQMLERLPKGLDTEIGEGGIGLSLGERQRLQMARILLGRPRLLILDEATATLDFATESIIKRSLASLPFRPTVIVIAHRFAMVRDADWVIVLEEGNVVEQGTPEQLRQSGGWFARLAGRSA
jgi:ATP-binding cassette subfamily B protein